ncbi:Cleavage stimulation factor subunit 2 (CF-1 64 kDa subunit) (Cleavage stimulation factor 64 kDa subunit) (CSTF 64 kDa subunit) (CstF-64), partial [Durusdinium trenchii]
LVMDKETSGMHKGFAFCEYVEEKHAVAAINSLDGLELSGRRLKVDTTEGGKVGDESGAARISAETKKEIENALRKLTMSEIYDIVSEMKMLIQRNRDHAYSLLKSKPVLAQALLTAQLMLGMAQISAGGHTTTEPPAATQFSNDDDDQELARQLLSLTPEQINALEPAERERVLEFRRK